MKVIGEKSVSSWLSKLMNIAFMFGCMAFVILTAITLLQNQSVLKHTSHGIGLGPLSVNLDEDATFSAWFKASTLSGSIVAMYIIYQLRNIFRSLATEEIFVLENARRIKRIGMSLIILSVILSIIYSIVGNMMCKILLSKGVECSVNYSLNIGYALVGVIVLLLAEVFKIATHIAEENELTI